LENPTIRHIDDFHIVLTEDPKPAQQESIRQQVKAFNEAASDCHRRLRKSGRQSLVLFLHDKANRQVGGLLASTCWGWLKIDELWLEEPLRGNGYGTVRMQEAEAEALARSCTRAHVKTWEFQAREFYERLGYRVVGELQDYPPGHTFYWLRKELHAGSTNG